MKFLCNSETTRIFVTLYSFNGFKNKAFNAPLSKSVGAFPFNGIFVQPAADYVNSTIYILSGLGADERVFKNMNFSGLKVSHVKWLSPLQGETIEKFASRLIPSGANSEPPVLIGLSFGGIMAIEIAKQVKTQKVIVIASAKTKHEIPFYFRFPGLSYLVDFIPALLLRKPGAIGSFLFGATTTPEKQLLTEILKDTDTRFLKWAIKQLANWKNTTLLPNIEHIHGSTDRILPIKFVSCNFPVKDGGHFMTLNKAEEVSAIIQSLLPLHCD